MSLSSINPLIEAADAVAGAATAYTLRTGQSAYGTISGSTDSDWFRIELTAGVTYDFRLLGFGLTFNSDPFLRVRNASGLEVAVNDDGFTSGSNTHEADAALTFTAAYTGTYFLEADSFSTSTGGYLLSATVDPVAASGSNDVLFTLDEMAWQLVNNGNAYFGAVEAAAFSVGADNALSVNITALTSAGQFLARQALIAWTSVTGIAFTEVGSGGEIVFDDNQADAFAETFTTGNVITSATVNVGLNWLTDFGTALASYSFETYIHEIGHALGLGHGGNYNGSAVYGTDNFYVNDSLAWSIMSYMPAGNDEFTGPNTFVNASFRYMFTPQIVDIIAIQHLYGDRGTAFAGNTTYGAGGNTGVAAIDSAVNSGAQMAMTVYDEGGVDTLNFSTAAVGQDIDLNAGTLSSVMGGRYNLGIARGVVIENAAGGSGIDTLAGNSIANWLDGGGGADIMEGGAGDDTLLGGLGGDTLRGGADNDRLFGGGGADAMLGGAGDDRYFVDSLGDVSTELAGAGFDTIFATISASGALNVERLYLQGTENFNATGVNLQNDILYGNGGNNILNGLTGTDNMNGGLGDDQYYSNTSGDMVNEAAGAGYDTMFSQSGNTIGLNVERLFLLEGGNYIAYGRNGQNDFLSGNSSANAINGFSGNDVIRGGFGNDTLTGGTGLDTFQFFTAPSTAANMDTITDFSATDDKIQLENAVYTLLAATGILAQNLFKNLSLGAQDADDRILYNDVTGAIIYDINGVTAGGQTQFALLSANPTITAADFVVI